MLVAVIVLAVVMFLFGLAMTRIRFRFSYDKERIIAAVRVWFIRIRILPKKKKKAPSAKHFSIKPFRRRVKRRMKKARKEGLKRLQKQRSAKSSESDEDKKTKRDIRAIIAMLTDMLKTFFSRFPRYLKTDVARLVIGVASDDAAKTALMYTEVAQASQYLITLLQTHTELCLDKKGYVSIYPDFTADEWRLEADIVFSIRIWQVAALAISLLKIYLRRGRYASKSSSDADDSGADAQKSRTDEDGAASVS